MIDNYTYNWSGHSQFSRKRGYEQWEMGYTLLCNQLANPTHSAQLNHDTPFTKDLRQRRSFPYHTTLAAERTSFHDVPPSLKEVPTDGT